MKITNETGLPEPVYQSLIKNDYSRGKSNRSVTQLIDSPRVRILRAEHNDEISEDASDMVWAVLGTAVHKMFEQHDSDGHLIEERLYAEVDNWSISGAIDLQRDEADGTVTIMDYKCTSVWSVIHGKPEWELQLNFYSWLVKECKDVDVSSLKIIAVLRDWQRKRAEVDSSYPQSAIVEVDVPLWDFWRQDAYVKERVKVHQHAEFSRLTGDSLPECSDHERWKRDDQYAVKKTGTKRAIKIYDSQEAAEAALKDGQEVEARQGAYVRCEANWCRVAEFCDQGGKCADE